MEGSGLERCGAGEDVGGHGTGDGGPYTVAGQGWRDRRAGSGSCGRQGRRGCVSSPPWRLRTGSAGRAVSMQRKTWARTRPSRWWWTGRTLRSTPLKQRNARSSSVASADPGVLAQRGCRPGSRSRGCGRRRASSGVEQSLDAEPAGRGGDDPPTRRLSPSTTPFPTSQPTSCCPPRDIIATSWPWINGFSGRSLVHVGKRTPGEPGCARQTVSGMDGPESVPGTAQWPTGAEIATRDGEQTAETAVVA